MRTGGPPVWVVVVLGGALVATARLVGIDEDVGPLLLGGPPFGGMWGWYGLPVALVFPVGIAALVVGAGPVVCRRLSTAALVAATWASSAAFIISLAAVDGLSRVSEPLESPTDYRSALPVIERLGLGTYVREFVDRLPDYSVHVRGHPLGLPVLFWFQEQLGLVGPGWSAALVILLASSAAASLVVTVRLVAGDDLARRAAPFLVLSPAAIWMGTTGDGLVAGVVAAAAMLAAVAVRAEGRTSWLAGFGAGVVGAVALFASYGAATMLLPLVVLVVWRRRWDVAVWGAVGAVAVFAAFAAAGFWWVEGLLATREEYLKGAGGYRPYWYFTWLGNPALLLTACGPAVVVALARLRDHRLWLVAGGALVGVIVADLSGMSKAEVERIWVPFVPFLTVAAASLPRRSVRWWLGAQAAVAVGIELTLDTPW